MSYSRRAYVLLFAVLIESVLSGDIPAEIPKCRAADGPCIAKTTNDILRRYPNGNAEFGLKNISNVELKDLVIAKASGDSPVQLNMKFNTVHVMGIENVVIDRVVGFEKNLTKSKFEIYARTPELRLFGDYEASGRVLLLPLDGKGPAFIVLKSPKFAFKIRATGQMRNGKVYATISKIKTVIEPEKIQVQLDNLFNGNRELGDSLNKLINENWRDIWNELKDGINGAVAEAIKTLIDDILQELSYDDFYRNDKR